MIAVDTNVLVHAHRADSEFHEPARACVRRLAMDRKPWAIPWPCVHEFLAVVTHPRVFDPPTPVERAVDQVVAWLESPSATLIGEDEGYLERFVELLLRGRVTGPRVHDARIAALCLHHQVTELWSADRDFSRFPQLTVRNPLVEQGSGP